MRVLGLDLGLNSIGFSLNDIEEKDGKIFFEEIVSNSIIFSEYIKAEDRRKFRSGRRRNDRASRRKEIVRKLLVNFNLASKELLDNPIEYFNDLTKKYNEPYSLRESAVLGKNLSKDEFVFSLYSIITRRGYSNLFEMTKEDQNKEASENELINSAVQNNKKIYKMNNYALPSKVLTQKKDKLEEDGFINIAIRNKKDDYNNSLDRDLWKEELEKLLESQKNNIELFANIDIFSKFKNKLLNGVNKNSKGVFGQRELKSVEKMVGYCSFYNNFSDNSQKRVINAHIKAIEFVLRQRIENAILGNLIVDKKTGEFKNILKEDIEKTINSWIQTPSSDNITVKNIFKNAGIKDLEIKISEGQDDTVQNIKVHKDLLEIISYESILKNYDFYSSILEVLHYYVSQSQIVDELIKINTKSILSEEQIEKISEINKSKSHYMSFSLKFIEEILEKLKDGLSYQDAISALGYFNRYIDMKPYSYLPPLNPSENDIKWLEENVENFKKEHLFYQALVSPNVKRIISILRKLINELIAKYGKIDKIIIETARELNSKQEEERIKKAQGRNKKEKDNAEALLKNANKELSAKNILRVRLLKEQKAKCLYSGKNITLEEALDESLTEVEHFIPRSKIWIDSYKNKILVFKSKNQNKSNTNPILFLKSIGEWDNFIARVNEYLADKDKKSWLTNEENIQKIYNDEELEGRFLNDTRSATKIVANYLEHYLFPKEKEHGKGESKNVIRVTGKAINELKRLWGINEVQPTNEKDEKDRSTNYHHTIDAIVISLLNESSKKALNDFFKQKENGFRTKAILEKLKTRFPVIKDGKSLYDFVKMKVEKYANNEIYVCPFMKKKENIRGFKDGNIKLIWDEKLNNFAQIDKKEISSKLLLNDSGKDLKDEEVSKRFEEIKSNLELSKQDNIKKALEEYEERLLDTRKQLTKIKEELKIQKDKLPKDKKEINTEQNLQIKEKIEELNLSIKELSQKLQIPCFFITKNGKKQIIRTLKIKTNSVTKADIIMITDKKQKNRVKRLNKEIYDELKASKTPFVVKLNDNTFSVDLYNTSKGQVIGLNYFSSIKNDIKAKISANKIALIKNFEDKINISKNDIVEITDLKKGIKDYFTLIGGNISGGSNKLELSSINKKKSKRLYIPLNQTTIAKKAKINFFGEINYEDFKKK